MGDDCLPVNGSSSQNEATCPGLECPETWPCSHARPSPYPVRKSESTCTALALQSTESPSVPGNVGGGIHSNRSGAYFMWPGNNQPLRSAIEREAYFSGIQKSVMYNAQITHRGQQASTLLQLMTIRAFHSKSLRRCSLGTALGFRTRRGQLTSIPAIIVFVARKVHTQWLHEMQVLPASVEGPGGIWCDVDVVEFSYFGVPTTMPKEELFSRLLDGLRGMDACIGSGTQVASQETYGTLGALVQSQTGQRQLGFITNRHVAVDLDYPSQKMFHPLPPNLGPGVYLGAVKRATSFVKDDLWYGIFAGMNPDIGDVRETETFVRADGAFIPFSETFDISKVTTSLRGIGSMGDVYRVELQAQVGSIVGRQVVKVGRSSGVTKGVIMGYAVEYNDEKGVCFLTDFLIVGENKQTFDLEGDSGSLILLTHENDSKNPQPVGLIWGGTANRGRLKLRNEHGPENWTSGVNLGRLLDILQLDIITTDEALQGEAKERIHEPVPSCERNQDVLCSPAAKDLLSLSSIGTLPLQRDNTGPSLDLAEDDLNMRLSGPSSSRSQNVEHPDTLSLLDPPRERGIRRPQSGDHSEEEDEHKVQSRGNKARKL